MCKGGIIQYKPEFCEMVIEHMKTGRSFNTFPCKTGVSRKTLYEWVKIYPEFAAAKEMAFCWAQKHFEDLLIIKGRGKKIKDKKGEVVIDPNDIDLGAVIFPLKA